MFRKNDPKADVIEASSEFTFRPMEKRDIQKPKNGRIPDLVDMTPDPVTWRRLIGQDQYDTREATDTNPTGDFTLKSPFTLYLATEAGPSAVEGSYAANLVVELWNP